MEHRWHLVRFGCEGGFSLTGAGDPAIDGYYCPDGEHLSFPRWTKVGGVSMEDSVHVITAGPLTSWVVTSGGTYAADPFNAKAFSNFTDPGEPLPPNNTWSTSAGGTSPAPVYGTEDGAVEVVREVFPIHGAADFDNVRDMAAGQVFFRWKIAQSLLFKGDDFKYFERLEKRDRCAPLFIRYQYKCGASWRTLWTGRFSTGSGRMSHSRCEFEVKPDPYDRYTCILDALNTKVNILGAAPVRTTASVPLDIEFGFSYGYAGSSPTPTLYVSGPDMVNGSNQAVNAWGAAGVYFIGDISRNYFGGSTVGPDTTSGELSGYEGSSLSTAIMDQFVADNGGPGLGTEEYVCSVYRFVWWRERFTTICNFGTPVPPVGSGWALVTDNCAVDGTALYGRPPAITYAGGNPTATGILSPSPPVTPCSAYAPAGYFGFDALPMFVCFDANGANPTEFNRARLLHDCVNLVLDRVACGVSGVVSDLFDWDAVGDAVGYAPGTNYVTGNPNQVDALVILQNSDAIDPDASNPATLGEVTLKVLLNYLRSTFRVYWDITNDGRLRLESLKHWAFPVGLDLSTLAAPQVVVEHMEHTGMDREVPRAERLKMAHAQGLDFVGADVIYSGPCVSESADVKEENAGPFTTDIAFIQSDPGAISREGFTVLATAFDGTTYATIVDVGALSGSNVTNAPLSVANLQRDFWTWDRYLPEGNVNGEDVTFDGFRPTIKQPDVLVKCFACSLKRYDPKNRVRTGLGTKFLQGATAEVEKVRFDSSGHLRLSLRYAR